MSVDEMVLIQIIYFSYLDYDNPITIKLVVKMLIVEIITGLL